RGEGDGVRAAVAILDHAHRGLAEAGTLHGEPAGVGNGPMGTTDVVQLLATRLRVLDGTPLPAAEKARLTATLADTLLRAISVDVIDQRLEALQAVLGGQKAKGKKCPPTPSPGSPACSRPRSASGSSWPPAGGETRPSTPASSGPATAST